MTNFGTSSSLNADKGTGVAQESYLRFAVSGVGSGTVQSARLRLYVPSNATTDGPGVFGCTVAACATWTEAGINWSNRPLRAQAATANVGALGAGAWVEWDVTPLIGGDGTHTLVVGQTDVTDGTAFSSDETTTNKPELIITVAAGGGTQTPTALAQLLARSLLESDARANFARGS